MTLESIPLFSGPSWSQVQRPITMPRYHKHDNAEKLFTHRRTQILTEIQTEGNRQLNTDFKWGCSTAIKMSHYSLAHRLQQKCIPPPPPFNGHCPRAAGLPSSPRVVFLHLLWMRTLVDMWHWLFYGPHVLPVTQPTVSNHWLQPEKITNRPRI